MEIRYYSVSLHVVAEKLRPVLEAMEEVKLAFLFGSVLRRNLVRDVDVGVHMVPEPGIRGYIELSHRIEDVVGVPVDVVPLTRVSPSLRMKIMRDGLALVVRDRRLFLEILHAAMGEAMDVELKTSFLPRKH